MGKRSRGWWYHPGIAMAAVGLVHQMRNSWAPKSGEKRTCRTHKNTPCRFIFSAIGIQMGDASTSKGSSIMYKYNVVTQPEAVDLSVKRREQMSWGLITFFQSVFILCYLDLSRSMAHCACVSILGLSFALKKYVKKNVFSTNGQSDTYMRLHW